MTATLPANNTRRHELSSQRTQIIRHVAKFSQHSGIVKVAGSRIARAAERDRACVAQHFPKTLRTLYRGCRGWTFYWFTDNDAAAHAQNTEEIWREMIETWEKSITSSN
jgi:hypothetical protein